MRLNVEVSGVSTRNKGAELMMFAIARHFSGNSELNLAITERFGTASDRAKYGLQFIPTSMRYGRNRPLGRLERLSVPILNRLLTQRLKADLGLISPHEIDVILDASGFAFGDQHSLARVRDFIDRVRQVRRSNGKVILLPQAFGPFRDSAYRQEVKRLFDLVDLAFARDDESFSFLLDLLGEDDRIQQGPDFTIDVGDVCEGSETKPKIVSFVPNSRMLDKLPSDVASEYVPSFAKVFLGVRQFGLVPRLLLHDHREDHQFVELMNSECGFEVEVVVNANPIVLKRYLSESYLVVGSRFHALVGGLSSGVPCIAVGWSHKYAELFRDFGVMEYCIDPKKVNEGLLPMVAEIAANYGDICRILNERKKILTGLVDSMWADIDLVLGLSSS